MNDILLFIKQEWFGFTGVLTTIAAYFFGGKKKQDVELKQSNADAVSTMQTVYDSFLQDYKDRMSEVMIELQSVREINRNLQSQFNNIQIQYAKEVEVSQNWEKLHKEIKEQYKELEKHYTLLQKDHDKLKKEFENYRKNATSK